MNRCSPVDARTSMELANQLMHAGIRFVPIPVFDDAEYSEKLNDVDVRLDKMIGMSDDNVN